MANLLEWREFPPERCGLTGASIRRWEGLLCGVSLFSIAAPTRHNPAWRTFRVALGDDRVHFDCPDEPSAQQAAEDWTRSWLARLDAARTAGSAAA